MMRAHKLCQDGMAGVEERREKKRPCLSAVTTEKPENAMYRASLEGTSMASLPAKGKRPTNDDYERRKQRHCYSDP